MQAAVGGGQTDDLAPCFERSSAVKTGETKNACEFVVAVVNGRLVETPGELTQRSVAAVGPRTARQFDVVVERCRARIVRVAHPRFTVVIAPTNPGGLKSDHLDTKHTVRDGVNPSVGIACGWGTHHRILRFLPREAAVARPHDLLHGDEENATAGGDADAGLFARLADVAELERHVEGRRTEGNAVAVGDEDACVLLDHDLRRFDDLGFAEASRKREGDDHQR